MSKILIVEDEASLLTALVNRFTNAGFTVLTAKNGEEGLESALKNQPDLILLDIVMPILDGITMYYRLRKDPRGKRAKVVLLTNMSNPVEVNTLLSSSVDGYLVKSDWKLDDIVKKVEEKLAK